MPNGRSNGSQLNMLRRVTLRLAAAHRENQRRFTQHERFLAELKEQGKDLKEELAELKKITTIHSKAIIKLLSR